MTLTFTMTIFVFLSFSVFTGRSDKEEEMQMGELQVRHSGFPGMVKFSVIS